jgi:hypothetical protein
MRGRVRGESRCVFTKAGRVPIDNSTVIGTEEWPLLGYNIFMRQSELGLPQAAGSATIGCLCLLEDRYETTA